MKTLLYPRLLLQLTLAITLLVPCSSAGEGRPLIAILGAFPMELAALHKEFGVTVKPNGFTTTTLHGIRFDRGTVDGHDVIIFQAGSSVVNAAFQLQFALDHFPITHVLFAGIAGGINPALQVGDVVIPERWAYHSEAAYLNEDGHGGYIQPAYFPKSEYTNFGMISPRPVRVIRDGMDRAQPMPFFAADADLLATARRAVPKLAPLSKAGRTISVTVGGVGVTGPVFLDNAKYREWVFQVWQARCLDMESTAYAQVCWANEKPLLVIRGLSDLAGGQRGPNPIKASDLTEVFDAAARVLHGVLDELPQ